MTNPDLAVDLAARWQLESTRREDLVGAMELRATWHSWVFEPGDTFWFGLGDATRQEIVDELDGDFVVLRGEGVRRWSKEGIRQFARMLSRAPTYVVKVQTKARNADEAIKTVTDQLQIGAQAHHGYDKAVAVTATLVSSSGSRVAQVALASEWQDSAVPEETLRDAMALLEKWRNWEFKPGDTFRLNDCNRTVHSVEGQYGMISGAIGSTPIRMSLDYCRKHGTHFERGTTRYKVEVDVPAVTFQEAKEAVRQAFANIGLEVRLA